MTKIYGIDLEQKVTPLMVRNALVGCFFKAHCEDTGVDQNESDVNEGYCKTIVTKMFDEVNGDFENPTKEDILSVMGKLAEFSKNFRNPDIIKKHAEEMGKLIEKM